MNPSAQAPVIKSPVIKSRAVKARRLPKATALPLLLVAAFALAGCEASTFTAWPDFGTGGLAERRPSTDVRIDHLSDRMVELVSRNARYYAAADTYEAERLLISIRRESEGQFGEDAEINIARLKLKMDAIERQLPQRAASGSR